MTGELFLSDEKILPGKNKTACTANLDDSVPAYFSAYVPPEIAEWMHNELPRSFYVVIGFQAALEDRMGHIQDVTTRQWISKYSDRYVY